VVTNLKTSQIGEGDDEFIEGSWRRKRGEDQFRLKVISIARVYTIALGQEECKQGFGNTQEELGNVGISRKGGWGGCL